MPLEPSPPLGHLERIWGALEAENALGGRSHLALHSASSPDPDAGCDKCASQGALVLMDRFIPVSLKRQAHARDCGCHALPDSPMGALRWRG